MSSRRDTLTWLLWGSAAVIGAPIFLAAMTYMTPVPKTRRHRVGGESNLPTMGAEEGESWMITHVGDVDVAVAKDGSGGIIAYELRCTHANCTLRWRPNDESFHCPCHGGRFDAHGEPTEGPPSLPMRRLRTERIDGDVIVVVGG